MPLGAWNADHARRYADGRDRLSNLIAEALQLGDLPDGDTADLAADLQSFVLGLTVQALIDLTAFPPERQIAMVDEHLATLAGPARGSRRSAPHALT